MQLHELEVGPDDDGRRLDQVLSDHLEVSRSQLERHIEAGCVSVDGEAPARGKRTKVHAGAKLVYREPPPEPMSIEPEAMDLSILHEDTDILVLDKPADVVVHPGEGNTRGTLLAGVLAHVGQLPGNDPVRPGVVHRLDRGTTGVMVFAKSLPAHVRLVEMFKEREVAKTYLAITQGVPKPASGTFDTPYGRHPSHRQRFSSRVPVGKRAVTHYETLEVYPGAAAMQIELETGRTHQIRVHFADAGFPLVGDETYTRRRVVRDPASNAVCSRLTRPALHAWELEFEHPINHRKMRFTAQMPQDLVDLVEGLREVAAEREQV